MNRYSISIEVEPTFFLRVRWTSPLSVRQVAKLREVGPGLTERPPAVLLSELRNIQETVLGPFDWKWQAEAAASTLRDADFQVILSAS